MKSLKTPLWCVQKYDNAKGWMPCVGLGYATQDAAESARRELFGERADVRTHEFSDGAGRYDAPPERPANCYHCPRPGQVGPVRLLQ